MKVAIDVSVIRRHQSRGIGVYTQNLVEALRLIKQADFSIRLIKQGSIPQDIDLVHYPYFDLFFLTLPIFKKKPVIVTIHDVIPLVFPDKFPKGIRGWVKFQIQKFSLKSVAAVITDSQNSKKDIVKYFKFPPEKIYVVPLAPDIKFRPIKSALIRSRIKVKYRLPERFILYVGDVNWNKNVEGLIKACAKLQTFLVLVGKAFMNKRLKETQKILRLIKELDLNNRIKILGYIPKKDLVAVYNLAAVYVQPSFYEGFGLPVLEAMACGTPVVCSKTASLPEVADKAALFINPYNINSIAGGIKRVLKNSKLKNQLIKKGFNQVKKFSWQKTAQETIKVYHEVLKRG